MGHQTPHGLKNRSGKTARLAENEVDNELLYAIERVVPTMTLTEARTRRERAEGGLKRAQYD